jgi:hypothetical protein
MVLPLRDPAGQPRRARDRPDEELLQATLGLLTTQRGDLPGGHQGQQPGHGQEREAEECGRAAAPAAEAGDHGLAIGQLPVFRISAT